MTGIATLAGASALSMSFATLFAGRIGAALRIGMLQALAAGLAAGAQGWPRHDASLCFAALLAFALNGLALPMGLRRLAGRTTTPSAIGWRFGFAPSATAALAVVAASVAGTLRLADGEQFELLALGMSIVLLGLLVLVVRSHRLVPALGLLASQNGIVVTACAIPDPAMAVLLLAMVPLIPSFAVVCLWLDDRNRLAVAPPWA